MSTSGASYGSDKTGTATKTSAKETQSTQTPTPYEVKPNENTKEMAKEHTFAYKKVATSSFCFNCGKQAEYFVVWEDHWEKYLCADCLKVEEDNEQGKPEPKKSEKPANTTEK